MISRISFATLALVPVSLLAQSLPNSDQAHTELPPLSVTADPFAQRNPVEATQATSVLAGDALERARSATLGETLASQAGVHSADFGAGASRPIIRGQAGPRVRILNGGSAVADASTLSPDHNVAVEPFRATQIEVLKGPASLMYGSGAIGGVINIVTDLVPNQSATEAQGAIGISGDSVNDGGAIWGHLETGINDFAVHLDGLSRETKDYDIPGLADNDGDADPETTGSVHNSAIATESWGLGLSWTPEHGFLGLGVSQYDTQYGVPGHAHAHEHDEDTAAPADMTHDSEEEVEIVNIDMQQTRVELRGGWQWDQGLWQRLRGSLIHNSYQHQELESGVAGTLFDNDSQELRLELGHRSILDWIGVVGLQSSLQDFSAFGEEAVVPPVETQCHGLFLIEERHFAAYRFSLGGRIEHLEHAPQGFNRAAYNLLNAASTLHREIGENQHLRLGLSYSQRAPDVQELYSNGPHLATRTYDLGRGDLTKESAINVDLGWHADLGKLSMNLDLFHTAFADFIFGSEVDRDNDGQADVFEDEHEDADHAEEEEHEEEGLLIVEYRQSDARFWGGELQLDYALSPQHSLRLFSDMVRAKRSGGDRLPRIPADRIGLAYHGESQQWTWGLGWTQVLKQTRTAALESPSTAYSLVSADVSWLLALPQGDLKISARARNLLDEEVRNHVSFLKDLAPQPGRNFGLNMEYSF
ncbi:MAG: TonB-dependent receptor [Oceanococcus sp.]